MCPDTPSPAPALLDEVVRSPARTAAESTPSTAAARTAGPGDAGGRAELSRIAICVDDRHPTLVGRVKVVWRPTPDADEEERWVATLQSTVVREGDRVLLVHPAHSDEPVVVGVVDGFRRRAEPDPTRHPTVELPEDEALRVVDRAGRPLVEIRAGHAGAELRLVDEDVALRVGGRFRIEAGAIEMRASAGGVDVEASDDVRIRGEVVKLN